MASIAEKEKEFADYSQIKEAYIRAFDRMLKAHPDKAKQTNWTDGQAVFDWWVYENKSTIDENQISMQDLIDALSIEE